MADDLKALERKAYRSTFQDGIWDIYLGLIFMVFGIGPVVRNEMGASDDGAIIVHIGLLMVALTILIAGKRFITVPRLGHVRFGKARQRKLLNAKIVLAVSVAVGLVIFALIEGDAIGLNGLALAFALNILVVLGAVAYFMDYDRLFLYAILWALSFPVGLVLEEHGQLSDAPTVFILTGGVAVVVGIVYLQRFLHDYRLPPQEESHG